MSENFHFESAAERIPTKEEVQKLFERFTEGKSYESVRTKEDDKGLYLWDIKITEPNGDTTEYSYMRAGSYPEGKALNTAIHVTFFDKDGIPTGGHSVAKCVSGQWTDTP